MTHDPSKKSEKLYGTVLRLFDNGGKTADRYTIYPPRWDKKYKLDGKFLVYYCSENPYSPQGVGMSGEAVFVKLGKRISWQQLPSKVKKLARFTYPEYAPVNDFPKFEIKLKSPPVVGGTLHGEVDGSRVLTTAVWLVKDGTAYTQNSAYSFTVEK